MIKKITLAILTTVAGFTAWAQSNPTPQSLPYSQNFSTFTGATTTYPAGVQGWTVTGSLGTSFTTAAPTGNQALAAGGNSVTSGGVYDMNGKIGILSTANAIKGICLVLNTSSSSNILFSFDAATQGQTSAGRIDELGLQYRIGTSGTFTDIALSTYSNNASSTINTGTAASNSLNISLTLPSACNNQSIVQLRWVMRDVSGGGNRPSFSIDNISATAPVSTPTIAITAQDPNTPTAVNWPLGSTLNQFYWASLSAAGGTATLSSVTANMLGTYLAADIPAGGLKLYYSTDATLVPVGDALLGSQSSTKTGATESITWSSLTQTIAAGATGYIYATADIASGASAGSTLAGSFTSNTNVVFTPTVNYNGSNSYGAITDKTFAALPTNPTTFSVNCASEVKINIDMNAPAVGSVLVFANTTGSFTDPTGAGSSFTGANANYTSATNYPAVGGKLVYSGSGANFAASGLTAGQNYSFKAYSYSGSTWSSGTSIINGSSTTQPVSATVVSPSSGQLQLSWTNPSATSCYNNVIIIARKGLAVESAVSKASFDGLVSDADFTAANAVWTLNSNANDVYDLTATLVGSDNTNFLVYKGTGTSVTLTGLTNGTPYYFRVFTVDGSGSAARWSAAIDANGTPVQPGYYWNGGSIAALPANGGTGIWSTTNAWRQPSASGSQATWANGNPAIFAGTAGAVTVDATRTATSYSFATTSYTVQTVSSTQYGLSGPMTLGANNELVLAPNAGSTANGVIALESVSGTGTASVTIFGNQQGTAAAARINIAVANGSVNVPTNIVSATGTGDGGYVATASGAVVNGNITNNSSLTTCIGATSGFDITMNGVISGTSGLQFSAGASGGAGTVTLNNNNTYSGETRFNSALTGVVVLGTNNALPTTGDVIMSYSSGNGGILDLNGFNQSIGNLSSNVVNASVIKNNSATSNSTLTINQTTAQTFGLGIKDGATKNVAIVKKGAAALTLTSNGNSFSGGLTITNGELRFNPASPTLNLPSCPIALNGGVLGTSGISASSVLNLSTLNVTDNSTITLNASATHTINFAASSGVSWTAGKTLVITGWQGVYSSATGSSGTAGNIFVGTGASDLTAGQLAQIKFFDGTTTYDATLSATGELVPYVSIITTQLRTTYCGYTAYSFGEFIGADSVLTATQYRFQLVNAVTSFNQVFTNNSGYPYLTLYTIPGISYNTTYTVTVAWSTDGVTWSPYGSPCTITSPTAETTQLSAGYCGFTATSYPQIIYADNVSGATQYEYKLENTAASYSQSYVKTNSNFNLTQFTGLVGGTTYSVSVRVFIFGAWDIYGPVCNVTTPITIPTTSLQPASCGITVSS
ncbi:MAG: autotransporter-associated beta strand repeat-containing protein, partial [Bacteroidota bacterium]